MLVSIIVPAYKKENTIKEDVTSIYEAMSQTRYEFEIIIVVDGTSDNTLEEAKKILKNNVKAYGYETNRGKGYAVRYGMAKASGDFIAFIDAGMEINPNGISMILEHMQWYNADIIVASKRHPASKVNYPILRKIYSWGYHLGVKFLFRLKLRDTQTGLKVYTREVLEHVLPRLVVKEFAFDVELLAVANHLGFRRIFEAPVELNLDFSEGSKFKKARPLFLDPYVRGMLMDTLGVFYRINFLKYYDDGNKRRWVYDKELDMRLNTGESIREAGMEFSNHGKKKLKFSVIIPVRSINDFIRESIEHLKKLDYQNFEVLIILDKFEEYDFKDSRFCILGVGEKGPGEKRNIGAKKATGDIFVFLDDDAYPTSTWLSDANEILINTGYYALGSPGITPQNASFLEKCSGRVLESWLSSAGAVHRYIVSKKRFVSDYPTVNLFVRREAFEGVGGFTEEFWPGEDTKFCLDLVNKYGRRFIYDPKPVVYHHRRTLFVGHLKQISRYGMHRGQFSRIFPETSRLFSYFVPSLFVSGLVLGPFLSFVFPVLWIPYVYILILYIGLLVFESAKVAIYDRNFKMGLFVGLGIFLSHIVYGTNFIVGLIKRPTLKLKGFDKQSGNYVEG